MLAIERRNEILSILQKEQRVLVAVLSKQYHVTEETIRRDLEKLEQEGLVKKTYGGAVLKQSLSMDMPYRIREKSHRAEKMHIAGIIAGMIEDGDSIMLDSSSTAICIARCLLQKSKLTIITNSVEILAIFADVKNTNIISTGGSLRESSLSLVGPNAVRTLINFNVDRAIISCKGMDLTKAVTESNEQEVEVKKAMINAAEQAILAVDSSKFDQVSFTKLMELNRPDLIVTDEIPNRRWLDYFEKSKIQVAWQNNK